MSVTTITAEERAERMSKALVRAQTFVKMQEHENVMCVTSEELFLFRDALKCAQTEIEHWDKLYLMMTKDEQRLTKMVDWLAKMCAMHCRDKSTDDSQCSISNCGPVHCRHASADQWKEAARRAVAAGEEPCPKQP